MVKFEQVKRLEDEVIKLPTRATSGSVGYDFYAIEDITLPAGEFKFYELQKEVFKDGKCVYPEFTLDEIREYKKKQEELLWDEVFRLEYPHKYYVDLSRKLIDYKLKMLEEKRG